MNWTVNRIAHLQASALGLDDADERKSLGIERLLSDYNKTISLVPASNIRHDRRND